MGANTNACILYICHSCVEASMFSPKEILMGERVLQLLLSLENSVSSSTTCNLIYEESQFGSCTRPDLCLHRSVTALA